MITIQLKFNDSLIKTIDIDNDLITIGRDVNNHIQIDNLTVSKLHARIVRDQGTYVIEDMDSTNGTYLNAKPITRGVLKNNDIIMIGKHTLLVRESQQPSAKQVA